MRHADRTALDPVHHAVPAAGNLRSRIDAKGESSMRTRIVALAVVMTVPLTAVPSFAHHSDVAYDQTKRTTFKDAKVISYAWRNPHGIMVLDVKDDAGEVVRWTL